MKVVYSPMYCGFFRNPDPAGPFFIRIPGCQLHFEHFARSFFNALQCSDANGAPTGINIAPEIVSTYGSFGMAKITVPDDYDARWANAHNNGVLAQAEHCMGATPQAAMARATGLQHAVRGLLISKGILSPADDPLQKSIDYLKGLSLSGHAAAFKVVRDSYVTALSHGAEPPTDVEHWIFKPPFYDPNADVVARAGWPLNLATMQTCWNELQNHGPNTQCRMMSYVFVFGSLSIIANNLGV